MPRWQVGYRACLAALLALLLGACAGTVPLPPQDVAGPGAGSVARELARSVDAIVAGGRNRGRQRAVEERARAMGLANRLHSEPIDWFSFQRNLVIDIPGRSNRMIYVVAHYDKTDLNPLSVVSVLLNGALDELVSLSFVSQGAIDNATGVALALELAAGLAESPRRYSYRVLLTGSEEAGLRGVRAHMARLSPEQRDAIVLAINIDTVAVAGQRNCVTEGLSDPQQLARVMAMAQHLGIELGSEPAPPGSGSDADVLKRSSALLDFGRGLLFNMVGGLLPQRSWFSGAHRAPVLGFSSCGIVDAGDYLGGVILLPIGSLHGPRDRASRVDLAKLHALYLLIDELLRDHDVAGP